MATDLFSFLPPHPNQVAQPFEEANLQVTQHNIEILIEFLNKAFRNSETEKGSFYLLGEQRMNVAYSTKKLQDRQVANYQAQLIETEAVIATVGIYELAKRILPLLAKKKLGLKVGSADDYLKVAQTVIFGGLMYANGHSGLEDSVEQLCEQLEDVKTIPSVGAITVLLSKNGMSGEGSIFTSAFFLAYILSLVAGYPKNITDDKLLGVQYESYWHEIIMGGIINHYYKEFDIDIDEKTDKELPSVKFVEARVDFLEALLKKSDLDDLASEQPMLKYIKGLGKGMHDEWLRYYLAEIVNCVPKAFLQAEIANLQKWLDAQEEA